MLFTAIPVTHSSDPAQDYCCLKSPLDQGQGLLCAEATPKYLIFLCAISLQKSIQSVSQDFSIYHLINNATIFPNTIPWLAQIETSGETGPSEPNAKTCRMQNKLKDWPVHTWLFIPNKPSNKPLSFPQLRAMKTQKQLFFKYFSRFAKMSRSLTVKLQRTKCYGPGQYWSFNQFPPDIYSKAKSREENEATSLLVWVSEMVHSQ